MKTLYLMENKKMRIDRDGPSLLVRVAGAADRRYPLARLSRVVAAPQTEWGAGTLLACMQQGVPVNLLDNEGANAGAALPERPCRSRAAERIEEFLARSDWESQYATWARAAERREILFVLRLTSIQCCDLRPEAVRQLLLGLLLKKVAGSDRALDRLRALLTSLAARVLADEHIHVDALQRRRPQFRLLQDMGAILQWRSYADLLDYAKTSADRCEAPSPRELTAIHEARSSRDRKRAHRLVDGFLYWIGGLR